MIDPNRLILLGEIGSAHGIRGEVHLRVFTGDPNDIGAYGPLTDKTGKRTFRIAKVRVTAKAVIAKLTGVDDRTTAETLRNVQLYVKRSQLPEPEPGTYYYEDLKGLTAADPGGTVIGTIAGVVNYGAGDLVEIKRPGERDTLLVPFTNAAVPEIDLAAGRAVIIVPEFAEDDDDAAKHEAEIDEE